MTTFSLLRRIGIGAAIFIFLAMPIWALTLEGVGGRPANPDPANPLAQSWFIYNLKPGESKEDAILLINNTDEDQKIVLKAVDSQPTNTGDFGLKSAEDEQIGIGKWIKLKEEKINVSAHSTKKVDFTIAIPENADVGEHSGAIVIQRAPTEVRGGFSGAILTTRVGIRVYETVPGEIIRKLQITGFYYQENQEKKEYAIYLKAKNEGNVSLRPETALKISGWGLVNYKERFLSKFFPAIKWNILRGQETSTNWRWEKPKLGYYQIAATLIYENNQGEKETLKTPVLSLWIIPPVETSILAGLIILLIIILVIKFIRNKGIGWQKHQVKKEDNLIILAKKFGLSWKRLAKVNKIKKPYLINVGQEILVPPAKKVKENDQENKQKIIKWLIIGLVVLVGLGIISWLGWQYLEINKQAVIENTNIIPANVGSQIHFGGQADSTATATSISTPDVKIDKSKVEISVLNGTSVAGAAGKVVATLEARGFKRAAGGNADEFNYQKTLIYFQPAYQGFLEEIKSVLADYPEIELIERTEQEKNVVIILGK